MTNHDSDKHKRDYQKKKDGIICTMYENARDKMFVEIKKQLRAHTRVLVWKCGGRVSFRSVSKGAECEWDNQTPLFNSNH